MKYSTSRWGPAFGENSIAVTRSRQTLLQLMFCTRNSLQRAIVAQRNPSKSSFSNTKSIISVCHQRYSIATRVDVCSTAMHPSGSIDPFQRRSFVSFEEKFNASSPCGRNVMDAWNYSEHMKHQSTLKDSVVYILIGEIEKTICRIYIDRIIDQKNCWFICKQATCTVLQAMASPNATVCHVRLLKQIIVRIASEIIWSSKRSVENNCCGGIDWWPEEPLVSLFYSSRNLLLNRLDLFID